METQEDFTPEEQKLLLEIARRSLADMASGTKTEIPEESVPEKLRKQRGCFVTLFNNGELRGCIGHVLPQMKLYAAVSHNACAAGFHDPRFSPVSRAEVPRLEIEISVLSDLQPIEVREPADILSELRPGIDGVLLRHGTQMSTFLPQVWETLHDTEEFLSRLCRKAGWRPEAWKDPNVSISKYQVVSFSEKGAPDQ